MSPPTPSESVDPFARDLFPGELEDIRARRHAARQAPLPHADGPSTELGLVGLALSGGGIRSATFSLGVIQGLARHGLLRAVDYLSTVSGGGFIGGAVSALLNDPAVEPDGPTFPLRNVVGQPDPPAVRHLRNAQQYLAPGGAMDRLRIPALMARGMLLNFLMIVPFVMLLVSLTDLAYSALSRPQRFFAWLPVASGAAFVVVAVTYPVVIRLVGPRLAWRDRDAYERITSLAFLLAILSVALTPVFVAIDDAVWMMPYDVVRLLVRVGPDAARRAAPAVAVAAAAVVAAGYWPAAARARAVVALYAVGVLGPAVPLALYLILCVVAIDPPGTVDLAMDTRRRATTEETATLDRERMPDTLVGSRLGAGGSAGVAPAIVDAAAQVRVIQAGRHWHVVTGDRHYVASSEPALRFWIEAAHDDGTPRLGGMDWGFLAVAFAWWLVGACFGNVNASSAHGFYRDRLSRAYLIRRRAGAADAVEPWDEVKLSELCRPGTRAPYHLVNASLNLNGTTDPDVRGRNCDFFIFSKRWTGSTRLGHSPTASLERLHPHLNLGTAMAISGAAAAPNAGVATVAPLAFILTLLDVRLGYWLPSPRSVRDAGGWRRFRLWLGTGPSYLLREALQHVNTGGAFVNLSDGGHIENLAIYQLLRRRCRVIVAVDGEQDGDLHFDGLMRLLLYARIDLGVDIDIDVSALRRLPSTWSGQHYAVGTIRYGAAPDGHRDTGVLLYLKASMTGDEDEMLRDYQRLHPEFPHEPTANQFFNERQWEMYRHLGLHVAERALGDTGDARLAEIRAMLTVPDGTAVRPPA